MEASNVTILSRNFAKWLEAERNAGKRERSLRKNKHLKTSIRIRDGCNEGKNIEDETPGDKEQTVK